MASKKKILVFIDWYLPGYRAGGPIQSCFNLVAHLSNFYEFLIVTRDTDYCETKAYEGVTSNSWNTLPDGSKVYYLSSDQLKVSTIKKIIQETTFDCAYINGVYSFYFSILPLFFLRSFTGIKVVAVRGMLASSAIAVKGFKKKIYLHLSNSFGLFKNVCFQASTKIEFDDIRKVMGNAAQIKLAGNLPKKSNPQLHPGKEKEIGTLRMVNIARIAPEKNLRFALEILKDVKSVVVFDFYGPIYNQSYFESCLQIIKDLPANVQVNNKGSIESALVSSTLQKYDVLFMPTQGENFGHIILEAFMNGCPVIISDQTPWQQLEEKKLGFDLPLDAKKKYVDVIERMAAWDSNEIKLWKESTFQFAKQYIDNPEIVKQNIHLFSD